MTSDRNQPGVAFWATVVVVVGLAAYPLSFGPAWWIKSRVDDSTAAVDVVSRFYYPLFKSAADGPAWLQVPLVWWMEVGQAMPDRRAQIEKMRSVTNRDVLDMTQCGVSDALICSEIRTRGGRFDTSPKTIDALIDAGVSTKVIEAMQNPTSARRP